MDVLEDDFAEQLATQDTREGLRNFNLDTSTWEGWANSWVLYAGENPYDFLFYVLMGLSPFFLLSMVLSLKLARDIEADEKARKRKAKKDAKTKTQ